MEEVSTEIQDGAADLGLLKRHHSWVDQWTGKNAETESINSTETSTDVLILDDPNEFDVHDDDPGAQAGNGDAEEAGAQPASDDGLGVYDDDDSINLPASVVADDEYIYVDGFNDNDSDGGDGSDSRQALEVKVVKTTDKLG